MTTTQLPEISVIIPTFNRAAFLKEAIESVVHQTYHDYELIIVDDGSTDETHEVVRSYGNAIRYEFQPRQGQSVARNRGVALAKGKIIAFLDADDLWAPTKLERQVQYLEENPHIDLLHCFTNVIDENGRPDEFNTHIHITHHRRAQQAGYFYPQLALECIIFTSCVMLKKDLFEKLGGFDPVFFYWEDWDFYLRLVLQYQIAVLAQPLVSYRIHSGQSKETKFTEARIQVIQKHLPIAKNIMNARISNVAQRNFAVQIAEAYYILHEHSSARDWYIKAFSTDWMLMFKRAGGFPWLVPHGLLCLIPRSFSETIRKIKGSLIK